MPYNLNPDKSKNNIDYSQTTNVNSMKYTQGISDVVRSAIEFHMANIGDTFQFFIRIPGNRLTNGQTIFTLKTGYRPATRMTFPICEYNGAKKIVGTCGIFLGGDVNVYFPSGQPNEVSICGVFAKAPKT